MRKREIYIPKPFIGGLLLIIAGGLLLSSSGYVRALMGLGQSRMNGPVGGSHAIRQPAANVAPGNLVAHYPLDGDAKDAAATSGNHLTDNNTVTQASTKTNAAEFVSANSEYLSLTDNAALSTGDIDFTLAAWVYPTSTTGTQSIASKYAATGAGTSEYILRRTGTSFSFLVSGGSTVGNIASTTVTVATNQWYYVVGWHDATNDTVNIQVNNLTVNSNGHSAGSNDSGTDFNMGRRGNGSEYFDGRIDVFGFWKRTLTTAERTKLYNGGSGLTYAQLQAASLTTSLNAYWELNELSGTRNDAASTNHLTDNATVTSNAGITGIATGNAAQFTAANSEYLSKTDNADLSMNGTTSITTAAWVYVDAVSPNQQWVIGKGEPNIASSRVEFALRLNNASPNGRFEFWVGNNSTYAIVSANSLGQPAANTWYYVVGWYDAAAGTINIQVNNGAINSSAYSSGSYDSSQPLELGRQTAVSSNYLGGRLDELGIWKRAITIDERATLYNNGFGRMYRDLPANLTTRLVSYWDMEEASGTRNDTHLHGQYSGTATGSPAIVQGKFGQAYSFDGVDDIITVSSIPSLTSDMSLSYWVNLGSNSTRRMITVGGMNVHTSGTSLTLDNSGGPTSNVTATGVTNGVWHHVVVTRSGTTYTLYVDNVSIGTSGGTAPTYSTMTIGGNGSGSYVLAQMDDVRVFNTVLSTDQITTLYGGSKAPACDQTCVGWWKMDETSGQTIADSSGTGNNGTLGADSGSASDDPTLNAPGVYSGSITLDATNDLVNVPDSDSLDFGTGNFSVSGWFKGSGATNYRALVYHFTLASPGFFIYTDITTGYLVAGINTTATDLTTTTNIRDGLWHHVVMVRSGATLTLYVDGISVGSVGGLGARSASSTSALTIGRNSNSNVYNWSGEIDDVRIYNRALAPYEIAEQYGAGR